MNTKCPHCGYDATGHETLKEHTNPHDRDISFCIGCGELSEFKNKVLVKVDPRNLDKETREEINKIRIAWLERRAIERAKNER